MRKRMEMDPATAAEGLVGAGEKRLAAAGQGGPSLPAGPYIGVVSAAAAVVLAAASGRLAGLAAAGTAAAASSAAAVQGAEDANAASVTT